MKYHYVPSFNAYWFGAAERRADAYWRQFHAERNIKRDQAESATGQKGERK